MDVIKVQSAVRAGFAHRIEKVLFHKKLALTTRTTFDRTVNAEHSIKHHVGHHQPGDLMTIVQQGCDTPNVEWECQETNHQMTAGTPDLDQAWSKIFIVVH